MTRIFFVIDQLDVVLLNEAGMLLTTVDRSFGIDVEDEPDTEIDTDVVAGTDRTSEADVDTTPEQDEIKTETSIFEMIINFIKSIFELLFTFIPVSYK